MEKILYEGNDISLSESEGVSNKIFGPSSVIFAKLNDRAVIPTKRDEDGGWDVYSSADHDITIEVGQVAQIPTGIISAFHPSKVVVAKERGSTGILAMSLKAGVIDSGYRNEWIILLNNTSNKHIRLTHSVAKVQEVDNIIYYPASKAIAQVLFVEVPKMNVTEGSVEDVRSIGSDRGLGKLGSSNK